MIVSLTCQRCHEDLRLNIDDFVAGTREPSPQLRLKLTARGWNVEQMICAACKKELELSDGKADI